MNLAHLLPAALAALAVAAAGCGRGEAATDRYVGPARPIRVLFIGNSYTYFHNMPTMIGQLAVAAGDARPLVFEMVTGGGESLEGHWNKGDAPARIQEARWDFVVLQEQSLRPVEDPARMLEFVRRFDAEIRKAGARTVLYLTWARRHTPEAQIDYNKAYLDAARDVAAAVAPVGMAWDRARRENPTWPLFEDDNSHPRPLGSYLAACVFYATLYGGSPVGLPLVTVRGEVTGTAAHKEEVAHLQSIAWDCVREVSDALGRP